MLGWLVHTLNIKTALQEPKCHPSPLAMSKIVFTTLILAVPVVNDGKCRRRFSRPRYTTDSVLNKANQKKPSF
jgi:hypothetical protein